LLAFISGSNPKLSLVEQSLYGGVVDKNPPPPLVGDQYGKMETKFPGSYYCNLRGSSTFLFIFNQFIGHGNAI
jgi:hypothetical protein